MVINQLIESIWKLVHLKNYLLHMLRGKKYQSNKKWPRLGLLKTRLKFDHSKVHTYLLVKIFVVIFFNPFFFPSCIIYWIFIKNIDMKSLKKWIWILMQNPNYSPYVHFRSSLLYDWYMFIEFHPLINVFIQVDNLNL